MVRETDRPCSDARTGATPQTPIALPQALTDGATLLVVGPDDPSDTAVSLRLLSQYGNPDDTALVVTTRASADETIQTWEGVSEAAHRPAIAIVDTTSEEQSIAAAYGEVPTVFTPSSGDVERIVMGLSELSGSARPRNRSRHLVIRSLTPILEAASTERVCQVLERIEGLRTGSGLGLYGIDVSAHDTATLAALAETVDGVVWVERSSAGGFDVTYQSNRGHVPF